MNQRRPYTPRSVWSPTLVEEISRITYLATAAAFLARHQVPVFPCAPRGKRPLIDRGFRAATCDLRLVEAWWRRWPEANIAVPTGFTSGVDVVDIDVHASGDGYRSFETAQARDLATGWAWLVRTPSGGMHAYFLRTTPDEQRCWQAPTRHIDFRGDGGYIVVPPSRTAEGIYRVLQIADHQPKAVDGPALRNFLDPPRAPVLRRNGPDVDHSQLAAWLANQPEGRRNRGLFWAACRMVENGRTYDDTVSTLGPAAEQAGLGERETCATIRSAFRSASIASGGRRSPPSAAQRHQPPSTDFEGINR